MSGAEYADRWYKPLRPGAETTLVERPIPNCFDVPMPGVLCPHHHRPAGYNDCWNLRDEHGDFLGTEKGPGQ